MWGLNGKISAEGARSCIIRFTRNYLRRFITGVNLCGEVRSEKTLKLNRPIIGAVRYTIYSKSCKVPPI